MSAVSLRVDSKGRITLPNKWREKMDINPGDTLFLNGDSESIVLKKAINPFDALAAEAVKEYKEGKTTSLEVFAEEMGIELE